MYYVYPNHPGIKFTRSGYCRMAKSTWRQCQSCGEINPKELHNIHKKPGCGGDVVTVREECGEWLDQVKECNG